MYTHTFNLLIYTETNVCWYNLNVCPSGPSKEAPFMTLGFSVIGLRKCLVIGSLEMSDKILEKILGGKL